MKLGLCRCLCRQSGPLQACHQRLARHAQGNVIVVGRKSPFSLYNQQLSSFEDDEGAYDQKDAAGFIKLQALRLKCPPPSLFPPGTLLSPSPAASRSTEMTSYPRASSVLLVHVHPFLLSLTS